MIENRLHFDTEAIHELPITSLIRLGQRKGYLRYDDLLRVIPEIDNDLERLETVVTALVNAGIGFDQGGEGQPSRRRPPKKST